MGFINAIHKLSTEMNEKSYISPFLQDLNTNKTKFLEVFIEVDRLELPMKPLKLSGIALIELDDEPCEQQREKYLYKPLSGNVSWQYSPVFPTGSELCKKGIAPLEKIISKIRKKVFEDLEKQKLFTENAAEKIENLLFDAKETIDSTIDKNFKTTIIFGIEHKGKRYLPGELDSFRGYFNNKIQNDFKRLNNSTNCSLCLKEVQKVTNLSKIFKFATFDKLGFLPGLSSKSQLKVFPICEQCYRNLMYARRRIQTSFTNFYVIPSSDPFVEMWIIPEVLFLNSSSKKITKAVVIKNFEAYLHNNACMREKRMFDALQKQDATLNFHFLFIEKQQAKEGLMQVIEDVSPSHLKKIQSLWEKNSKKFTNSGSVLLDTCFSFLRLVYINDSESKRSVNTESKFRTQKAVELIAKLLRGERINTNGLKKEFVSRFPKIMHSGNYKTVINNQFRFIEFLEDYNREGTI